MADAGERYQSGSYLDANPSWHVEDSPWKARHILRMIRRNRIDPQTIAEVGCGAGEILVQLSRSLRKSIFVGYEISPQAFEICKPRETDRIHFLKEDLLDVDSQFDLVLTIYVFEHVDDYLGFLRRLRSKGNWHLFHIPLDLSAQSVARGAPLLGNRRRYGHLHYFSYETAIATLEDAGYEVLDSTYTHTAVDLAARSTVQRIARLPRAIGAAISPAWTARLLGGFSLLVLAR